MPSMFPGSNPEAQGGGITVREERGREKLLAWQGGSLQMDTPLLGLALPSLLLLAWALIHVRMVWVELRQALF